MSMDLAKRIRNQIAVAGLTLLIGSTTLGCAETKMTREGTKLALGLPSWYPNSSIVELDGSYHMRKLDFNDLILTGRIHIIKNYMKKHNLDEKGVYKIIDENGDKVITTEELQKFLRKYER